MRTASLRWLSCPRRCEFCPAWPVTIYPGFRLAQCNTYMLRRLLSLEILRRETGGPNRRPADEQRTSEYNTCQTGNSTRRLLRAQTTLMSVRQCRCPSSWAVTSPGVRRGVTCDRSGLCRTYQRPIVFVHDLR